MKKKLLIIPLLLLTSCNDPMFFEGKKATEEEVNAFIGHFLNRDGMNIIVNKFLALFIKIMITINIILLINLFIILKF